MRTSTVVALIGLLCLTSLASAEDSNQVQVRQGIAKGGWTVFYGEKITEAEYIKLAAAVTASVASGNPAPVLAMLDAYVERTIVKLKAKAPGIATDVLRRLVYKAITSRNGSVTSGKVDIKFGVATYNRWQTLKYKEPRTRKVKKTKTVAGVKVTYYVIETYLVDVEKKVPLPNWHDPYIAIRIR